MERSPSSRAFTLVEMIVVIAVIAVLSVLVIALAGPSGISSRRAKAQTEKNTLVAACETYKTDNGGYPQDNPPGGSGASVTNDLDPRIHFSPTTYAAANLFLYKQLTGDDNANGAIDAGETGKRYTPDFFKSSRFDAGYRTSGTVSYYTDPFGYPFGYSTAGLKAEQDYQGSSRPIPPLADRRLRRATIRLSTFGPRRVPSRRPARIKRSGSRIGSLRSAPSARLDAWSPGIRDVRRCRPNTIDFRGGSSRQR